MARVLLGIRGMDSQDAMGRVRTTLQEIAGVSQVEVNNDRQAAVVYDPAELTIMDLIRALRKIGFLAGME